MKSKKEISLLSRAQSLGNGGRPGIRYEYSKETWELLSAFLKNEVGVRQTSKALGFKNAHSAYAWLLNGVKDAVKRGNIKLS